MGHEKIKQEEQYSVNSKELLLELQTTCSLNWKRAGNDSRMQRLNARLVAFIKWKMFYAKILPLDKQCRQFTCS